jgi:hypothetical protein
MIIHDLEFFNCCDQEYQKSDVAIIGGASSSSSVKIDASNGEKTVALSSVGAEGDDSYSLAIIGDKVIKKYHKGYSNYSLGHYSASYEAGYGGVSYSCSIN